jgi:hypothetical protein
VGAKKQDFWLRKDVLKGKKIKNSECQFVKIGHVFVTKKWSTELTFFKDFFLIC